MAVLECVTVPSWELPQAGAGERQRERFVSPTPRRDVSAAGTASAQAIPGSPCLVDSHALLQAGR